VTEAPAPIDGEPYRLALEVAGFAGVKTRPFDAGFAFGVLSVEPETGARYAFRYPAEPPPATEAVVADFIGWRSGLVPAPRRPTSPVG